MTRFTQVHARGRCAALAAVGAAVVTSLLAGCAGVQSLPLPGGANTGGDSHTYRLQFADVTDLVPKSAVKENGVSVGEVTSMTVPAGGWDAVVTIKVKGDVRLSDQARAAVEQTSLLGEKYVALYEPDNSASLPAQNSATVIPAVRTKTAASTEDVLGSLSALYNGGGLNQLQPIVHELDNALDGNTTQTRALLNNAQVVISGLDDHRDDINAAIVGLDDLSARTAKQTVQIDRVLKELPAGISVLKDQRPQFVEMLDKLHTLGDVGSSVLGQAHDAMITDLKSLGASLPALAKSGDDIVTSFPVIDLFPFPDDLLPAVHGDSTSIYTTIDLRELNALEALGVGQGDPQYSAKANGYLPADPNNPWVDGNKTRWSLPPIWDWNYPSVTMLGHLRGTSGTAAKDGTKRGLRPAAAPTQQILDGPMSLMGGEK